MSASEFRLLPWERGGHLLAPATLMSAQVEGRERHFWVKTHEGGVYFRFADEDERDERVWTLLEHNPETEFESAFRREVEANRVARFFMVERGFSTQNVEKEWQTELKARFHPSNLHLFGPTAFAVVVSDDGHVFAQEWCGGAWVEFDLPPRQNESGARRPSIWSRAWNVKGLRRALASVAGEFAFRPFVPPAQDEEPLRFVRGSQRELETLFQAANVHFVSVFVAEENRRMAEYARRYGPLFLSTMKFNFHIQAETRQRTLNGSSYRQCVPRALMDLFLAHNLPVGGAWGQSYQGESMSPEIPVVEFNKRIDFHFMPHSLRLETEVAREPSAHERMEALLTLREWLEEKGYGTQIRWLLDI